MRGLEVAAIKIQPCQLRQQGCFAILIVYLAADVQGFVEARQALVVISGIPAERAEAAERSDEFGTICGHPENRQRTLEELASFFHLAELRIGFAEIGQRGGFTIRVVRLAAKRQRLRMKFDGLSIVRKLGMNVRDIVERNSSPAGILDSARQFKRFLICTECMTAIA